LENLPHETYYKNEGVDICGLKVVSIKKLTFRSMHIMKSDVGFCKCF